MGKKFVLLIKLFGARAQVKARGTCKQRSPSRQRSWSVMVHSCRLFTISPLNPRNVAQCAVTQENKGGGGEGGASITIASHADVFRGSLRVPALLIGAGTRHEPLRTSAWEASITKPGQPQKGMSFRFFFLLVFEDSCQRA